MTKSNKLSDKEVPWQPTILRTYVHLLPEREFCAVQIEERWAKSLIQPPITSEIPSKCRNYMVVRGSHTRVEDMDAYREEEVHDIHCKSVFTVISNQV